MKVVVSAGHGKHIRGMSSEWLDEVDEARRVTTQVADNLREAGVEVVTYFDDVSNDQSENLDRICDAHNAVGAHDLDVSVHFNASNGKGHGVEVWYTSDAGLEYAAEISTEIADASGLTDRGAKNDNEIGGLYFLSNTAETAVLIEVCFGDNETDCVTYFDEFDNICEAIDRAICNIGNHTDTDPIRPRPEPPDDDVLFTATGTCSTFGGPDDTGVSPSEGLAFFYEVDDAPWLFLKTQPPGTTGLARRMDPAAFFIACRWNYDVTSKEMLGHSGQMALVTAKDTGVSRLAHPADWGPHEEQTGRAADLSPALAESLGVSTDDEVTVVYPYKW